MAENEILEVAEEQQEERVQPLTAEAWKLYHEPLDNARTVKRGEHWGGTRRSGFFSLSDIRRLANWLAGGPGEMLEPADFIYMKCVQGTEKLEVILNYLLPYVQKKMSSQEQRELFPEEQIAHFVLEQGEDPVEVFDRLGVSKESVEARQLVQPIDAEMLNLLVHPDGGLRSCLLCEESYPQFQPVEACRVERDLSAISTDNGFEAALCRDFKSDGLFRIGSFVVLDTKESPDSEIEVAAVPFHGHPLWNKPDWRTRDADWKGPRWLLREIVSQNKIGHLGEARARAAEQKKGNYTLAYCLSETLAKAEVDRATVGRQKFVERKERERAKLDNLFPKQGRLRGGREGKRS